MILFLDLQAGCLEFWHEIYTGVARVLASVW